MTEIPAVNDNSILCRLHYREFPTQANLPGLSLIISKLKSASILGANSSIACASRFSYWAAEPKEIFEFHSGQKNPFDKLQNVLNRYNLNRDYIDALPDGIFCGGWVGFFSYELCRYIELVW